MAKKALTMKPAKLKSEVLLTPEEMEDGEYERLRMNRIARQKRMEDALRCTHGSNRDRILLQERLESTIEMMGIINSIALGKASLTEGRSMNAYLQLDSNMRELMHELRVLGTNEETVAYIADQFAEVIQVLLVQDLNLKKAVSDEVSKLCDSETTKKVIDRMESLIQGKGNLYDEMTKRFIEKLEKYLAE